MVLSSLSIIAILQANLGNEKGTTFNILFKLIGIFVEQGAISFQSANHLKIGSLIALLCCLLSTTVLTKCFTSLLLGTFFKTKPSLTVETLEDIVSNPEINVIGRNTINELKSFYPEIYENIHKRNIDYEKQLNAI